MMQILEEWSGRRVLNWVRGLLVACWISLLVDVGSGGLLVIFIKVLWVIPIGIVDCVGIGSNWG